MTLAQTKNPNPCQQLQVLCAPPGKENWDLNGPEWMARAKTFIAGKRREVYVGYAEKVRGKSWHSLEKLSLGWGSYSFISRRPFVAFVWTQV